MSETPEPVPFASSSLPVPSAAPEPARDRGGLHAPRVAGGEIPKVEGFAAALAIARQVFHEDRFPRANPTFRRVRPILMDGAWMLHDRFEAGAEEPGARALYEELRYMMAPQTVRPAAEMTLDEAIRILNRECHRGVDIWDISLDHRTGEMGGCLPSGARFPEFEIIAIAEKYERLVSHPKSA
jgi:hypothetical protein